MKITRRSCVGIYLWHALTLLFYMLNSVGLLLLFHFNFGVWRYLILDESETRLTLFLYPFVSCYFGVLVAIIVFFQLNTLMKVHYMKFLLVMLGYMISNVAFGHDFEAVNGDVVIYYDIISDIDKTVKVTYKGNYSEEVYYEYSGNVSIPQTVNYNGITYTVISLGDEAFYWCSSLTSVLIPNSIISIGEGCFNKCTNLTSVEIPNSVTSIGVNAFRSCI